MLLRRKVEGRALSIDQSSNIAYVSTLDDLTNVRSGSYLRLSGKPFFYIISNVNKVNIEEPFEITDPNRIVINKVLVPQLQEQDTPDFLFSEYELDIVSSIMDHGTNYKIGDILSVVGGSAIRDNITSFLVKMVDSHGGITKIGVNNRGKYSLPPEEENLLYGGNGKGAKFDISFVQTENSLKIQNQIIAIASEEKRTVVFLKTNLPKVFSCGKLSMKKWTIELSIPFNLPNVRNITYDITRDFTPVLNLPLLAPNSLAVDVSYNQSVNVLEQEIISLRERIKALETQLSRLDIGIK